VTRREALRSLAFAVGFGRSDLTWPPHAQPAPLSVEPPLRRSDVVFMYEADRQTYRDYGATVLAWGGAPTAKSLAEADGIAFYGSVGMVTEFADYYDRFPDTWHEGVCLDVDGRRIKVPWLVDMSHAGEPYWWCCTRQPVFRQYLEERVTRTLEAGARGLHVDDHLGSSGALFLQACFCPRCVAAFRDHLAALDGPARDRFGIADLAGYDYGAALRRWRAEAPPGTARVAATHPLWPEWRTFQLRSAAEYMKHLRRVAERAAGRPVPMSANAGLLWPNHLADYEAVDFFSAEIDHQAEAGIVSDRPLFAYRMADSMGRPLAATAGGEDWAAVLAQKRHRLATSWAALGYASGHMLMAPHRQWCHTEEKGTHWYDGPREVFAPIYRFARDHAALVDGFEPWADVALVMPHRAFAAEPARWIAMGEALAGANVPYRVVIGGDEVVAREISAADLAGVQAIVTPATRELLPPARSAVEALAGRGLLVGSVEEALRRVRPAVRASSRDVRVLPRVAKGRAVIHLVNRAYDAAADSVRPLDAIALDCDLAALGVAGATRARVVAPGREAREVAITSGRVRVDVPTIWAIVELGA
jgi:hypothetical protein